MCLYQFYPKVLCESHRLDMVHFSKYCKIIIVIIEIEFPDEDSYSISLSYYPRFAKHI